MSETIRDCNTCRHHVQAGPPKQDYVYLVTGNGSGPRCAVCLLDLAMSGELSCWEPEVDPKADGMKA